MIALFFCYAFVFYLLYYFIYLLFSFVCFVKTGYTPPSAAVVFVKLIGPGPVSAGASGNRLSQ